MSAERWMHVRVDRLSVGDVIINPVTSASERVTVVEPSGRLTRLGHTGRNADLMPSATRFDRLASTGDPLAVLTTGGRTLHAGEALALDGDGAGSALCGTYAYATTPGREVTCKRCLRSLDARPIAPAAPTREGMGGEPR